MRIVTCRYANKPRKLACAIPKGKLAMSFSSAAASLCPRGAGERGKRKRAGNDGHAFVSLFLITVLLFLFRYLAGAPAEERARHVIFRRVKSLKACLRKPPAIIQF